MCGIVGVVGEKQAYKTVMEGLKRLEYRGYDSAGVVVSSSGTAFDLRRAPGKLINLENRLKESPFSQESTAAIGHTRWATHGEPNEANAHPHINGVCAVVHNGIIENFQSLRERLGKSGTTFHSDTDTETVPALISHYIAQGLNHRDAVIKTINEIEGAFSLGMMFSDREDLMFAARRGAPLCIGLGNGKNYITSDPMALAPYTNKFMFLANDDIAEITTERVTVFNSAGEVVERPIKTLDLSGVLAGKAGFPHFMLKEIHEQPVVIARLLEAYVNEGKISLPALPVNPATLPSITMAACGTAYYACITAKYIIESLTGIRVDVDIASEFRYRNPPLTKGGLFVAVSQSGETADTLAALHHAKEAGLHTLTLTNTPTSTMARDSDVVIDLMAETEVAVASTKAFTAMVVTLALLGLQTAQAQGKNVDAEIQALKELPAKFDQALSDTTHIEKIGRSLIEATDMFYLGRGALAPLAFEGSLKLKEISYIHAEAYPAGELKHGPIALIEKGLPVVGLALSNDGLFEKTISNLKEVEARQARVIVMTDEAGAKNLENLKCDIITIPNCAAFTAPLLMVVPLQLLSYHVATAKGTDVDQPRNLAKSVTVE